MSKFFIKQAFAEAMDLQKNGRLSEAKEIYHKILGQSPNDANALHLISLVFMAEGNYNEAKSYIEKAINEAPNQAVFHSNYGGLLHTMGDLPASVKALKKSLKLDKKLFQSYYSLGIVYTDMEELEKAVESYTKALEIDQSSTAAHNNLGNLLSKLNNPEAEYHYKKLIELMGNEVFPRLNMSNYLIRNQRYDDAFKYLNELVELNIATKEVFNSLGVAYKGLDNDTKAREMFNEALKLDSNFDLAKGNLESLN